MLRLSFTSFTGMRYYNVTCHMYMHGNSIYGICKVNLNTLSM
jgi:hypothetical protein